MSLIELSLKGKNISYDQLEVDEDDLNFNILENKLSQVRPITNFNKDILITLGLITNNQYNIAARLVADKNQENQLGIDIVRFGNSISAFLDRKILSGMSILTQYDEALLMFTKHFPEIEVIEGLKRIKKTVIPYKAFREALANVMHSLEIIERFGTGIRRINNTYLEYERKPKFIISDTFIKVILPNLLFNDENMNEETRILNLLDIKIEITRQGVESLLSVNKTRTVDILNKLREKRIIDSFGTGENTVYKKIV